MAVTEEELKRLKEARAEQERLLQQQRDEIELAKIRREGLDKSSIAYKDLTKAIEDQTRALQAGESLQRQRTEALTAEGAALEKIVSERKAALELQEARTKGLTQELERTLGLGRATGSLSDRAMILGKTFGEARKSGVSLGVVLKNLITRAVMKPFEMLVDQTYELAKAQDAAISSFRRATGAAAEFNLEITQLERRNFAAGVSAKESGEAINALFSQFTAFTQMSPAARAALSDTTGLLGELGVSASTTASILDKTTRATGMSAEESRDLLLDLAGTATSLGVPISKLAADFEGSFGELAKYGTDAIKVFKGLEVQAKNSGLAMNQLLKIAGQFDQFDSAGQAVGRLNAILGGPYLNSIDMLNATEEERIEILRRSTDAAGIQFDALNRFEQQAIASAMGTSVEEAQRLFNMSEEQYTLDAMKQQELQELARETQEIGQQLKTAFMALAVDLRPLIDEILIPMVKFLGQGAKKTGELLNGFSQAGKAATVFGSAVGIAAVGAILAAAPLTGGASLALLPLARKAAGVAAVGGGGGGGLASMLAPETAGSTGQVIPGFQAGGTVTTKQAIVHPGEILLTGGQGSEVISKEDFKSLVDTLKDFTSRGAPQQIAVYVGQEKIDDIVVKALDSTAGRNAFSPFTNG